MNNGILILRVPSDDMRDFFYGLKKEGCARKLRGFRERFKVYEKYITSLGDTDFIEKKN